MTERHPTTHRDPNDPRDPHDPRDPRLDTPSGLAWQAPPADRRGAVQRRTPTHRLIVGGAWVAAGAVVASSVAFGWGPMGWLRGAGLWLPGMGADRTTEVTAPVSSVAVTSDAVDLDVRYDDVPNARILESDLPAGGMTWRTEGTRLVVEYRRGGGPGIALFTREQLTIVLPRALEDSKPDLTLRATTGSIDLRGGFGVVDASTSTGSIEADGHYDTLRVVTTTGSIDVRATVGETTTEATTGSIDLRLDGADVARATTSTGSVDIVVEGEQPDEVFARTGAGSVDIQVPAGTYAVQTKAMGSADVEVGQDPTSPHRITAETGAGSIDIQD